VRSLVIGQLHFHEIFPEQGTGMMNDEFILFSSQNLIKKFHFEDGTTAEKMAQKMPMWSTSVSIYAVLNISIV
jgi:hypothetical protein